MSPPVSPPVPEMAPPPPPDRLSRSLPTSPTGQRVSCTSDPQYGRIRILLHEDGTTRTLLSAQGPGEYTDGLDAAFWSPGWQGVAPTTAGSS